MLKENQKVKLQWNSKYKKYYESLGYEYTKMNDFFEVNIKNLKEGSHVKIIVFCDYCGKEFKIEYRDYNKKILKNEKIACFDCKNKKSKETCMEKYGVSNVSQCKEVKEKRENTFIEKYGAKNPFENKKIKEKICETNLKKYGVKFSSQNEQIKEKFKNTCINKYGVSNPNKTKEVKEKIKKTNLEKYGVEYTMQSKEIRRKAIETLCKNGNVPSSKQENELYNMLCRIYGDNNCEKDFILDRIIMDCMLEIKNIKIDIEYDGWYWHKNKVEYDMKRDYFVKSKGFKVLRIKGNYELPKKEQLIEAIDYLVNNNSCNHKNIILDINI